MHRAQIFGYFLTAFLLGVFAGSFVADPNRFLVTLIVVGAGLLLGLGYRDRMRGIFVGGCVLCAAVGVFRFGQANLDHSVLTTFAHVQVGGKGVPVQLLGYIDREPTTTSSGNASLAFRVKQLSVPGKEFDTNELTLITVRPYPEYRFGELLAVKGSLELPDNFAPDFDYISYLKNRGIRTTMLFPDIASSSAVPLSVGDRLKLSWYKNIFAVKGRFEQAVASSLSEPFSSYINGILVGGKQNLPDDVTEAFNKTGTTHVLAISGYNITIIAETLLMVLVFFMRRRKAFYVATVLIILFTIMTGAGASVVRAAVMGIMLLVANGYGRLYDPKNAILTAAAVMVWINPLALRYDIGFQLSFLAVIGIMYVYPLLEHAARHWKPRHQIVEGLKETLLMTISAQVTVAPLLIYYFKQFSLVSLPANVLVLPLMPFTMLFGFLSGVLGIVWLPLGRLISFVTWILASYQLHVITWFGRLPWAAATISFKWFTVVGIYALIIWLVWKHRRLLA